MASSLALLALLALTALAASAPAPGQSFSVKAKSHRLSSEAAAALTKHRSATNPAMHRLLELMPTIKFQDDSTGQATIIEKDFYQIALIGNISVGTPAVTYAVMFDLTSSDLMLVDANATFDAADYCDPDAGCPDYFDDSLAAKNTYNASLSSSATTTSKKFRGSEAGDTDGGTKGTIVKDTVSIGGITNTMSFGDVTQVGFLLDLLPVDGVMGISAAKSKNKIDTVLKQVVGSLTSPVVTIHVNRSSILDNSAWPNTDAEIMFGSNALPQCNAANWKTVSLNKPDPNYAPFNANATSFTIASPGVDGPCDNTVAQTSHPLYVTDSWMPFLLSVQAFDVFRKASGATYNANYGLYSVDCTQISSMPNVNIGLDDGNAISLAPQDYVLDLSKSKYKICLLWAHGLYDEGMTDYQVYPVALGQLWLNNHCISYDIKANTLSYTDALPNNGN